MVADNEKQAALMELKQSYDQVTAKLRQLESQKRQSEMSLRRAAFTATHLDELPDTVKLYKGIGKAYFLEPKAEIMSELEAVVKANDTELKQGVVSKEALTKEHNSLRKDLEEAIASLQKS